MKRDILVFVICVKICYTYANICYIQKFSFTFNILLKEKELLYVCHEYRSYVHNSHSASKVQYIKFLTRNLLKTLLTMTIKNRVVRKRF